MSNLTPDDVDLRLTATKAELTEEDQRLWLGLEDEKISRIAGDEANKQSTELVKQQNSGTESRLSTEVIHRSEGDLSNLNSLNAVAQALSDYRIKTDLEINNEIIARKALGVELNTRIDNFVTSWDHQKYLIYQAIQDVQNDLDGKYASMDVRIKKYENMLSDITTDSIQITMDNGEINMGAWTILSQAREWDLQIIAKMSDYQIATTDEVNQALDDFQKQLPIEQDIIDKAIQGLSNAQVIKDLDSKLDGSIQDISVLNDKVNTNAQAVVNEMIQLSAELTAQVNAAAAELDTKLTQESGDRIAEIAKETATRTEQVMLLEDGLTQEINDRIDGDNHTIELIDNLKVSNDESLANIREELRVTTGKADANATAINALDVRLIVAEGNANQALVNAASATEKAETAVTATEALASRVQSVETSLVGKVDQTAFNVLEARTTATEDKVEGIVTSMTTLQSEIDAVENTVTGHTTAINSLQITQTEMDGKLTQTINDTTLLKNEMVTVKDDLSKKLEANALNDIYTITETNTAIAGQLATYNASLVIGGVNLLNNTMILSNTNDTYRGGKIYRQSRTASQTDTQDFGISMSDLDAGDYTLSFDIKSSINVPSNASNLSYFYGPNNTTKIVSSQGYTATNADGRTEKQVTTSWQRIWITWTQSSATESKGLIINRIYGNGLDYTVDIANVKFEKGNKATAWTPAESDIQNALNANASALTQTNASVNALEGVVTSHSTSITSLNNEVTNLTENTSNISNAVSVLRSQVESNEESITNQASSLVKLDAAIKANTASDNLIPNPTFDSAYDQMGYTVVPSTNSEVPANCPYKFVAKLNSRDNVPAIEDIACTAGDVYELSVYAACAEGTHNFNLMIFEKDSKDGSVIGFPASGLAPSSVWTKKVWRWTVPVGTAFFRPVLQLDTFDNSTTWYVTNWTVNNISAAAEAQSTADATANTLVATNATVTQQGNQIVANTASIQSAESRISTNESSIQNIQNTYATKDSVGSLAQTALESVWQNDITEAVNDISVGGVNLLSNTTYLSSSKPPEVLGGSYYSLAGLTANYYGGMVSTGENHFVINNVIGERYIRIQASVSNSNTLKPNSTYTFSVKIRGAAKPLGFRIIVQRNGVWADLPIKMIEYDNNVFSTHGYTFTIPTETTDIIISLQSYSVNLGESFAILNSSMKLEEGNVITAWTPSTSDVQSQIDATSGAVSNLSTSVSVLDGKVTSQASSITQLQSDVSSNSAKLVVQGEVVDGLSASYVIKTDVDGLVAGYGLYNTGSTSAFGVNADYFYVGKPGDNKKPFMVLSSPQTIGGVTYPAGTWIDVALIANATIGTAMIANAAITNAKIADLAVDNAKIANLNAEKITAGIINADRIGADSITADKLSVTELSAITGTIGVLRTTDTGSRMEIRDNVIICYNDNVKRVQLGNLAL